MAVQERRTRYWEWRCDGPACESVGRQFTKTEQMPGWLAAKVTTSTVKAFCSRACFERWMESLLTPAVEAGLPEEADIGDPQDPFGHHRAANS